MSVGDLAGLLAAIAGLIAAIGFVWLVGALSAPLLKLGRVFDEAGAAVRQLTEHTVPVLDEAATAVASSNTQLEKVDAITTAAASVSENVSALTALFTATVGGPLIKVAAFSHGVRRALASLRPGARR